MSDDRDTVHFDYLSRLRQLAVAAALRRQVHNDGTGAIRSTISFVTRMRRAKDAQDARGYATAREKTSTESNANCSEVLRSRRAMSILRQRNPGKKSPILVTKEMVERMAPGSVIMDLAAERGGNCELTQAGKIVKVHGVTIIGTFNLASTVPYHASQMYAKNLSAFLLNLGQRRKLQSMRRMKFTARRC